MTFPVFSVAQDQGSRSYQCDHWATHRDDATGAHAFVVLDGIGDCAAVSDFVRYYAPRLAEAAARQPNPADALAEIRAECSGELHDAVAVAAVYRPDDLKLRFVWSGDSRAYWLSRSWGIECATRDHNAAQELRDQGREPGPYDHNAVTSTLGEGEIGTAEVKRDRVLRVLLCTDGAYHPLETYRTPLLENILSLSDDAQEAAADLVREGVTKSRTTDRSYVDNATALVVDFASLS
jgi:serine/threonine protein phosphatase PrpC